MLTTVVSPFKFAERSAPAARLNGSAETDQGTPLATPTESLHISGAEADTKSTSTHTRLGQFARTGALVGLALAGMGAVEGLAPTSTLAAIQPMPGPMQICQFVYGGKFDCLKMNETSVVALDYKGDAQVSLRFDNGGFEVHHYKDHRLLSMFRPDGTSSFYTYDEGGMLISQRDDRGEETHKIRLSEDGTALWVRVNLPNGNYEVHYRDHVEVFGADGSIMPAPPVTYNPLRHRYMADDGRFFDQLDSVGKFARPFVRMY